MFKTKVTSAKALPKYRLALTFSDGTRGVASLADLVGKKPYQGIQSPADFRELEIDLGAVEWPAAEVGIATEALYALAHGLPIPQTLEDVRAVVATVALRELRKAAGKTQAEIAAAMGINQGSVSTFESEQDHKLSALTRYVRALGGELEVTVVLGGKRVPLGGSTSPTRVLGGVLVREKVRAKAPRKRRSSAA